MLDDLFPVIEECQYYNEEQFNNRKMINSGFFIIHINSRSMNSKFSKISDYLKPLNRHFSKIAVSETWLSDENINNYQINCTNRSNKRGRGVALFVDIKLKCKIRDKMSLITDGVMEMIPIEVLNENSKNIVELCVSLIRFKYRIIF